MVEALLKQLQNFGLSEKEGKIYLALLELEMATVFEVAKQSGINRSSAYVVLETLKKKGLVGISDDKKVRKYIAASPETLLHSAKTAAQKQEDLKDGIESIIPELKALYKGTGTRPIVKVFEGENGAKEVYQDLFATKTKELRTFADLVKIFKRIPDFIEIHDKERGRRGIKMFVINPASKEMVGVLQQIKPTEPAEYILIPEGKCKFSSDMGIYGDKVSFISPKDNFGVIIESKDIADMLRNCFDLAWEEAKRLDKKIKKDLKKRP
ncbi:MAG: helix-turn-helix domain-containing protein [Candidatus Doudnabacteria bacterium]|jgi:sugar-specific transcriptional regulator TrmB